MKPNPVLSRFELIADTPGNIQLLRKLVVYLAVSGRLLDTLSNDLSTQEILSDIASRRQTLIKSGKAKKQRVLPPIDETELPTGCQDSARFERLENIATLEKGLTAIQRAKAGDYPLVTTGEHKSSCDHYDFEGRAAVIPMVSSTGHGSATLKRLHYQEGKFAVGNILCAVFSISDELLSARFIFEYLTTFKEELLVSKMIGTANVSLTLGKIGEVPIPVVPPTVQRRVDELMTLCDRFEEALESREKVRGQLVTASLHRLNGGANGQSLRTQASFYFGHLPRLTTSSEHIEQLRQTILNLAVRGQLVPQDPNDEPAFELLKRIEAEKARLVKDGLIKKVDSIELPTDSEFPFPIPSGWAPSSLQSLCTSVTDGDHLPPPKADQGVPFLVIGNVRSQTLSFAGCRHVSHQYYEGLDAIRRPQKGDILYTLVGSYGIPVIITDDRPFCVQRHIGILRPSRVISARFLSYVLESKWVFDQATACATGIAQKTVPLAGLRKILIPLPPLAEQHRIVARLTELMRLCDQLESQLSSAQSQSHQLLEAVLHHALRGTAETASQVDAIAPDPEFAA